MNKQNLAGAVSVGADLALDKAGASEIIRTYVPQIIGSVVVSSGAKANASSENNTTPGNSDAAVSLWGTIKQSINNFTSGITSSIGNAVNKVKEFVSGYIPGTEANQKKEFAKTLEGLSSNLQQQTVEEILQAGNGDFRAGVEKLSTVTDRGIVLETAHSTTLYDNATQGIYSKHTTTVFSETFAYSAKGANQTITTADGLAYVQDFDTSGILQKSTVTSGNQKVEITANNPNQGILLDENQNVIDGNVLIMETI